MPYRIFLILALSFLTIACENPTVKKSDIIGAFYGNYYGHVDILNVLDDGTYEHTYNLDNKSLKHIGIWNFESFGRERFGVTFNDFAFRKKNGELGIRGYWHTELEGGSKLKLCFEYDVNHCFEKKYKER